MAEEVDAIVAERGEFYRRGPSPVPSSEEMYGEAPPSPSPIPRHRRSRSKRTSSGSARLLRPKLAAGCPRRGILPPPAPPSPLPLQDGDIEDDDDSEPHAEPPPEPQQRQQQGQRRKKTHHGTRHRRHK